ncbi:MAG TPA: 50S ribosomal protein L21 [Nitrospiria bacterium]|nr:50S ribosomal protein L21 [Nitrospiria bacterium]
MYAIIETGSKQYRVEPGTAIRVEQLAADVGAPVTFDRVLLICGDGQTAVGTPVVAKATVTGEVIRHGLARKIVVFKKIRRKNYRRTRGHRQRFTEVKITAIQAA